MPVEAPRLVDCADCGEGFELSARNVRANRKARKPIRCRRCRGLRDLPPPTEAHRRYWLERYSLEEIRELAGAIWPRG